jgi:hypothetical protein
MFHFREFNADTPLGRSPAVERGNAVQGFLFAIPLSVILWAGIIAAAHSF